MTWRTQVAGIIKGWEDKQDNRCIYIPVTPQNELRPPDPLTIKPRILLPNIFIYLLNFNQFPPPRGRHASCREMSETRRLVKLKDMKKEIFLSMPLSCGLSHRRISALPGLHKAVGSHNYGTSSKSCIHPHKPSPYTILLACLTSKHLFFKQSLSVHSGLYPFS